MSHINKVTLLALCAVIGLYVLFCGVSKPGSETAVNVDETTKEDFRFANDKPVPRAAVHVSVEHTTDTVLKTENNNQQTDKSDCERTQLQNELSACLGWAQEALVSENYHHRIQAMLILTRVNPAEAVDLMRMLVTLIEDDNHAALVGFGIRQLVNDSVYLSDSDLNIFYEYGDNALKLISASVLAQRGDDGLIRKYIDSNQSALFSDAATHKQFLQNLSAFGGSAYAAETVLPSLKEGNSELRLQALQSLIEIGKPESIEPIKALYIDEVKAVRDKAKEAVEILSNARSSRKIVLNLQPGMIADGLPY